MTAAAQNAAWLAALSQNDRSPKGDLILRGPFGELVTVGIDDVPPEPHGPRRKASNALQTGRSTSLGLQGQDGPIVSTQ